MRISDWSSYVCSSDLIFQFVYPCGNFSDTSSFNSRMAKGSIGHAFTVCIRTENQNQGSFYPSVLHEISVLIELPFGRARCNLRLVPPQPNSPTDYVFNLDLGARGQHAPKGTLACHPD